MSFLSKYHRQFSCLLYPKSYSRKQRKSFISNFWRERRSLCQSWKIPGTSSLGARSQRPLLYLLPEKWQFPVHHLLFQIFLIWNWSFDKILVKQRYKQYWKPCQYWFAIHPLRKENHSHHWDWGVTQIYFNKRNKFLEIQSTSSVKQV